MSKLSKLGIFVLFLCCFFCINVFGRPEYQVSVTGIFPVEETISIIINSDDYKLDIDVDIVPDQKKQTIHFCVPVQHPIRWIDVVFKNELQDDIFIDQIRIEGIMVLSAKNIVSSFQSEYNHNIELTKNRQDGNAYCRIHKVDPTDHYVRILLLTHNLIKYSLPIGLQLFFRLSLIAVLLFLVFLLYRQASDQQFLLLSISLFLVSVPLRLDYTNWTMIIMSLTMVIAFIRNKSRKFTWQPIFYVLCAIYLLNVVGLIYTGDINLGIRRLDSNIPLVLFPVIFSMVQLTKRNTILLLRFFVWFVIAFCAFGLLSRVAILPEFTWDMAFRDSKQYAPLMLMWPAHHHQIGRAHV